MLSDYFFTWFYEEVKEEIGREGTKEIVEQCCQKFRSHLFKKPAMINVTQQVKILAMVL
jgi:hypothetical protein